MPITIPIKRGLKGTAITIPIKRGLKVEASDAGQQRALSSVTITIPIKRGLKAVDDRALICNYYPD